MSKAAIPEVEVKREKIFIGDLSIDQIQKKYSLKRPAARRAKKTGFL